MRRDRRGMEVIVVPVNRSEPLITTRPRPTEKTTPPISFAIPTGHSPMPCCEVTMNTKPSAMKAPPLRDARNIVPSGAVAFANIASSSALARGFGAVAAVDGAGAGAAVRDPGAGLVIGGGPSLGAGDVPARSGDGGLRGRPPCRAVRHEGSRAGSPSVTSSQGTPGPARRRGPASVGGLGPRRLGHDADGDPQGAAGPARADHDALQRRHVRIV